MFECRQDYSLGNADGFDRPCGPPRRQAVRKTACSAFLEPWGEVDGVMVWMDENGEKITMEVQ